MQRIVVAAKAGTDQPWVADAAAQLAKEIDADVHVVSVDGVEMEGLSTMPRSEFHELAQQAVDAAVTRIGEQHVKATGVVVPGRVTRGILLYAEEHEADLIVCGASSRGVVASRMLGSVPTQLIRRARRPVLVITKPEGASHGNSE